MSIDPGTLPHYKRLLQQLKKQIVSGVYEEGDLLPSEHELRALHGVSRSTVRKALEELVREGYVVKQQGKGSIVSSRRKTLGLLSFSGFSDVADAAQIPVTTAYLQKPRLQPWPDPFFYPLSLREKEAGCIYFKRLRSLENNPVMLESTFLPNLNLPRFVNRPFVDGSLFHTLHIHHEIEITDVDQDIKAIRCAEDMTPWLQLEAGEPILRIYRKYHSNRRDFFVYSALYCNTNEYSLSAFFT